MIYSEAMTVDLAYAQEHLSELLSEVDSGVDVIIERDGAKPIRLVGQWKARDSWRDHLHQGDRVLGRSAGIFTTPTDEEWRAMDEEIEREFSESDARFEALNGTSEA